MELLYRFSKKERQFKVKYEITLSEPAICAFYSALRSLCSRYINKNPIILRGPGIICQVDESLFCHKAKYNRGLQSEDRIWAFVICDTSFAPAKGYIQIVSNRSADVLLQIISKVCMKGTIIHIDDWRSYRRL
ncbi:hypothetical protein DMUE_3264 [Dictyocoela muelleri]|nr:hypothetical protein DMUE_3264 [Dictyocoela muelleri]